MVWQTPTPYFLAWVTLWKPELFMRQAFSCAPSSSQKLYIIVNWNTSELSSSSEAFMPLLTWWGWIMHGLQLSWLPVWDGTTLRLWKQNTIRIALLFYIRSYSVGDYKILPDCMSCAVLWWFLVQATSTTIQYHQTQIYKVIQLSMFLIS